MNKLIGGVKRIDGCLMMMFLVSLYYLPVATLECVRFHDKDGAKRALHTWAIMMAALIGALGISLLFQYLRK